MTWGLLRHGAMNALFGGIRAPSTLGSHLRSIPGGTSPRWKRRAGSSSRMALCPSAHRHCRDPGTFRAHCIASCPEPLRTAEISAAGQPACTVYFPLVNKTDAQDPAYRPAHPLHAALTCGAIPHGGQAGHIPGTCACARPKGLSSASRARQWPREPGDNTDRWPCSC
jgi:hypothetical protein